MSVSILAQALVALGVGFSSITPEPPTKPSTHTLTIKLHDGGQLLLDGAIKGDTIIQLNNANIATLAEPGKSLYTVTLPSGEIFYQGDFTLVVQSLASGTQKFNLQNGEAILSKVETE